MSQEDDAEKAKYKELILGAMNDVKKSTPWVSDDALRWQYICSTCGTIFSTMYKMGAVQICNECLERLRKVIKRQKELEDL